MLIVLYGAGLALVYGIALAVSLIIFAGVDRFVRRKHGEPTSDELLERRSTIISSRWIVRILIRGCLVPVLLLIAVYYAVQYNVNYLQHPSFEQDVGEAQPATAHVVKSNRSGVMDTADWVHFTISPKDMAYIISRHKYEHTGKILANQIDFHTLPPPLWWHPEKLGGIWQQYQSIQTKPDDHRYLLVNALGNDVYACRVIGFD